MSLRQFMQDAEEMFEQRTEPGATAAESSISPRDPSFVSYLAIRQAMNALNRLQERYVVDQPASEIQSYVCAMIVRAGRPLRMGDIAKFLCLEPQTITGLIKRMEAKGLVTRVQSTGDRRQVLVDVTEGGRSRWEHAMHLTQSVRREAFAEMSLGEHVRLASVMIGIRDIALTALGEDPAEANALMRTIFSMEQVSPFEETLAPHPAEQNVSGGPPARKTKRSGSKGSPKSDE